MRTYPPGCRFAKCDGAELPAAYYLVYDSSMVEKLLAFTEWQHVEDGSDETLRMLKSEGPYSHVVGTAHSGARSRPPPCRGCYWCRPGPWTGVAQQGVQVAAQTRGPLGSEATVIPIGGSHHILDSRGAPFRIRQALNRR